MRLLNNRDITGGLALLASGLAFAGMSFSYGLGSLIEMGPGMFPLVVGILIAVCAVIVIWSGLRTASDLEEPIAIAPLLIVTGALLVFGLTVRTFGLMPAIVAMVFLVSISEENRNWAQVAIVAVVLATLAYLIFILGLGMNVAPFSWNLG